MRLGLLVTALAALLSQAGCTRESPGGGEVEIRWTAFGIPHIRASDERGLGYGVGYAYARDNLCLLSDEVLTARGERSRFLGRDGQSSARLDNVSSDLFFTWLNDDAAVDAYWQAQPAPIRQLLSGYAAGFNRYLDDRGVPAACQGAEWVRPLQETDLVRLIRRLMVEGGVGRFAEALLAATPPSASTAEAPGQAASMDLARLQGFAFERGSNAIAVGGQRTENGRGRLLANPHFPWFGALRFYQMHLTIPGKLDVMGASLPGLPLVNIGFNRQLAWTHTVDTSSHFTLHRLALDPDDPERYRVDGTSYPLQRRDLRIQVREADGSLSTQHQVIHESRFGPLLKWPGVADWDRRHAYALQDANLDNTRALQQWYAMNRAGDVQSLREAVQRIQGIPWVNTLAADRRGQALYMNVSVVPNIPRQRLASCIDRDLQAHGLPGVDGSRSDCDWQTDDGAAQPGIIAGTRLPVLQREDYLQNANDSAWMSNPQAPLSGFSPLVSRDGTALGLRTRYALAQLAKQGQAPLSEAFLKGLVDSNRVHAADLLLDDLLQWCHGQGGEAALARACAAMASWDRSAGLDATLGWLYFQAFMLQFQAADQGWRHPFDPQDPLNTPRGIAWQDAEVARALADMLQRAVAQVDALKLAPGVTWGQLQGVERNARRIPVPGGDGHLGIYNAIQSVPQEAGRLQVVGGSSYIQLVSFDERGPVAQGLLAFSQSSDPDSAHFADQTELFARQAWQPLPFTPEQIEADPQLQVLRLRQ
ncbi:bifunctional acylase PvdQ [Phytopseudomonas dryadis]|uniref:bifunctional acylase PvdQ n=1 Tax=Pseudomonadaceae TaxID=135621 RepID=UPI001A955F62|nr:MULTISPECIES: penicillin acylase family protein [Pseudomonas]